MIHFVVPTVPISQPRPRATIRGGHAAVYGASSKHPIHTFKATVRLVATNAYGGAPLAGPVALEAVFVFPRPKNMFWKTRDMPRVYHEKTPDLDNVLKSLMDAMTGIVLADDKNVVRITASKWVAAADEQPHVEVKLWELP